MTCHTVMFVTGIWHFFPKSHLFLTFAKNRPLKKSPTLNTEFKIDLLCLRVLLNWYIETHKTLKYMGSIVKYIITTINPILLNMLAGSPLLNRVNHGSEFSNNNFTTHPMQLNKVHIQFILQNCFTAALHQVQYSYPWSRYCSLCVCFWLTRH